MTIFCERVGLGKKILHRHPKTHCTLWPYESGSQLLVLRSSPSTFFRDWGAWPPDSPLAKPLSLVTGQLLFWILNSHQLSSTLRVLTFSLPCHLLCWSQRQKWIIPNLSYLNDDEFICERVWLWRKVLYRHPYAHWTLWLNRAASYWSSVLYHPNFRGMAPCPRSG